MEYESLKFCTRSEKSIPTPHWQSSLTPTLQCGFVQALPEALMRCAAQRASPSSPSGHHFASQCTYMARFIRLRQYPRPGWWRFRLTVHTALWAHSRESYPPRQLPVCFDILSQGLPLVPLVLDVSLKLQKSLPGSFAQAFAKVPPSSSLSLQSPWQRGCTSGF